MHLSCKCASEFALEGQLRLQLAPFLRTRHILTKCMANAACRRMFDDVSMMTHLKSGYVAYVATNICPIFWRNTTCVFLWSLFLSFLLNGISFVVGVRPFFVLYYILLYSTYYSSVVHVQ